MSFLSSYWNAWSQNSLRLALMPAVCCRRLSRVSGVGTHLKPRSPSSLRSSGCRRPRWHCHCHLTRPLRGVWHLGSRNSAEECGNGKWSTKATVRALAAAADAVFDQGSGTTPRQCCVIDCKGCGSPLQSITLHWRGVVPLPWSKTASAAAASALTVASVDHLPFPHCCLPSHNVSTASQVGCVQIASNSTPIRPKWCVARPLVSCHNM